MTLNELVNALQEAEGFQQKELIKKSKIEASEEYMECKLLIEENEKKQKKLLSRIIDYSEEMHDLELLIIEEMQKLGIKENELVELKFKDTKKVNARAVKEVLRDEDAFWTLANITQKSLKDMAKSMPGLKKPLYSCIETVKSVPTGIAFK